MIFKDYIKENNINNKVTELRLNGLGLTDLDGIEKCTNLKYLYCYDNNLTILPDLSRLTNLTHLYCYNNNLPYETEGLSLSEIKLLAKKFNRNKSIDNLLA